jgi:hypothetical protein
VWLFFCCSLFHVFLYFMYILFSFVVFHIFCGLQPPGLKWFDLVGEFFDVGRPSMALSRFFVVSSLQQSFNSDCCLYRIRLFTEFFCILVPSCATLKKLSLFIISLGPWMKPLQAVWSFWTFSCIFSYICAVFFVWTLLLGCPPFYCCLIICNPLFLI